MIKQVFKETIITERIQVFGDTLHRVLVEAGIIKYNEGETTTVAIQTEVPSGADYSGMKLDIDSDNPIFITIQRKKNE